MPFTDNWLEELVAEWLSLDGFFIEIGLPVSVSHGGERYRADIVGARVQNNILEIKHIECGQLAGGQRSINSIKKKFSEQNQNTITQHIRIKMGFQGSNIHYEKIYIANYWTMPTLTGVGSEGITVHTLPFFICSKVLHTIDHWKRQWISQQKLKTKQPKDVTLPESCWLLKLIEDLHRTGLLDCMKHRSFK